MSGETPSDNPYGAVRPEDCAFYHSMDLPGVGEVFGQWDLRGRFDDYVGHVDLKGKTVLDVGAASGFLTFEAEKRGAIITSFDAASADDYDTLYLKDRDAQAGWRRREFDRLRAGYWLAHRAFGSSAKSVSGSLYRLNEVAGQADVVIAGQILVHVRDPFAAIRQICLTARETIVITEGSFHSDKPMALFAGLHGGPSIYSFWLMADDFYRRYLALLGWEVVLAEPKPYRCNVPGMPTLTDVWTFVARPIGGS